MRVARDRLAVVRNGLIDITLRFPGDAEVVVDRRPLRCRQLRRLQRLGANVDALFRHKRAATAGFQIRRRLGKTGQGECARGERDQATGKYRRPKSKAGSARDVKFRGWHSVADLFRAYHCCMSGCGDG